MSIFEIILNTGNVDIRDCGGGCCAQGEIPDVNRADVLHFAVPEPGVLWHRHHGDDSGDDRRPGPGGVRHPLQSAGAVSGGGHDPGDEGGGPAAELSAHREGSGDLREEYRRLRAQSEDYRRIFGEEE